MGGKGEGEGGGGEGGGRKRESHQVHMYQYILQIGNIHFVIVVKTFCWYLNVPKIKLPLYDM